jgi:hypothetical protein
VAERARMPTMNFSTRLHPLSHLLMSHPPFWVERGSEKQFLPPLFF